MSVNYDLEWPLDWFVVAAVFDRNEACEACWCPVSFRLARISGDFCLDLLSGQWCATPSSWCSTLLELLFDSEICIFFRFLGLPLVLFALLPLLIWPDFPYFVGRTSILSIEAAI